MLENDFLLNNEIAKYLYHQIAQKLPIIDYHNHLNPLAIANNKKFKNITELWIYDDQYKHRLMRINGVGENYITGDAPDYEKFLAWMETLPKTIGNPVYQWSQLEISYIFGADINLLKDDPLEIWQRCNQKLGENGFGVIDILKKWNVAFLSTSDDLLDGLETHQQASADQNHQFLVKPSLRADAVLAFETPTFTNWLTKFTNISGIEITNLDSYLQAINIRLDYFQKSGCLSSDHALDSGFIFKLPTKTIAEKLFAKLLNDGHLTNDEIVELQSYLLQFLGIEYGKRKLVMQLHIGAQRTTSTRLKKIAAKYGGFAAIGNPLDIESICMFLDTLEKESTLPKTILYTLNAVDNERIGTLTGSFTEEGIRGKVQFGPAWWFNDHYDGFVKQLTALASYGMLSTFIGMTSDSRSFLSLSRHYYFRRILCSLIGEWVEKGLLPDDKQVLQVLVEDICCNNAIAYINVEKKELV
ncbi:glucuronate isomerase [Pedobacter jamesrossensis]|uniref:Uronate isomerase n=1 Tax=Pedobacter jamesrossensis TaxID=1908238 RepID=A0ABV8NSI8_9SPHI